MADYIDCSTIDQPTTPIVPPRDPVPGGGLPDGGRTGQVLTKGSDADGDVLWADGGGGGSLLRALTATKTVGGVTAGQTIPAGTSFEELFRMILAPSLNPTLTAPSATLTTTVATLREKGDTVTADFIVDFNRGSINPAYGTSGYRSGAATGYTLNGGSSQNNNRFQNVQISESNNTFQASVAYAAGEQPKDSTGANYSTPLPAGSVNTNTITFEFVEALYGTTVALTAATKQPLVRKSAGEYVFEMCAQTDDDGNFFDIPASWNLTGIYTWNPITSLWNNVDFEFDSSDVTHEDAGGNTIAYKRYTDNRHAGAVGRRIKVTWGA